MVSLIEVHLVAATSFVTVADRPQPVHEEDMLEGAATLWPVRRTAQQSTLRDDLAMAAGGGLAVV